MKKYCYTDSYGSFRLENPEEISYLYFPLAGESGIKSCVTPSLGGDTKLDQNSFLLEPVTCESLHNNKATRNFWIRFSDGTYWSATGCSSEQEALKFSEAKEQTTLEAGLLYHKMTRFSKKLNLQSETTSFVPLGEFPIELTRIVIRNVGESAVRIQGISAVPLYARSADNIRDHRNVTSMLHRIYTMENGVVVNPTLTFDERGHKKNTLVYGAFGSCQGVTPEGFYPIQEEFLGEGGSFEHPYTIVTGKGELIPAHQQIDGFEAMGGIQYPWMDLDPGQTLTFISALAYGTETAEELSEKAGEYLSEERFEKLFIQSQEHWREINNISYQSAEKEFDQWMYWVNFQPVLRRIFGCSFLPHHDYGKGGRGWRDLWQDCLALLLMDPDNVRSLLLNNFKGVRIDGTNATIIGEKPGEFVADRNGIPRVWMDHGMWPFLTVQLYLNQTGDYGILQEQVPYFKDHFVCRGEERDEKWLDVQSCWQKDKQGNDYEGSVLEHLLLEHLTAFFDVGEHNHIRLRGADWNDALDMAKERGESVAFTTMYAANLKALADIIAGMKNRFQIDHIMLLDEIATLLKGSRQWYEDVAWKNKNLRKYCRGVSHFVSGKRSEFPIDVLVKNLKQKAEWIMQHIQATEWLDGGKDTGWFNGYYDNDSHPLERGMNYANPQMMLTSQVFAIMSGIATERQIAKIVSAADRFLYDPAVGGYRLNTDFKMLKLNMGRMYGFAYGQKENGAVFSHMTVMYAKSLYERGFIKEGYKVIRALFDHVSDIGKSRIYPGVPEYVAPNGRGVYHYLTGAASWLLYTVLTDMYGVKGKDGNLVLAPKLMAEQFDQAGKASVKLNFAGCPLDVTYTNANRIEAGKYSVSAVTLDGERCALINGWIPRDVIENLDQCQTHKIEVILS